MDDEQKPILIGSLISLPILFFLFRSFNPPQCPVDYTQEQLESTHCVIGANIGGVPLFIISIPIVMALSTFMVNKLLKHASNKRKKK